MDLSVVVNMVLTPLCAALIGALSAQAKRIRSSDKAMRDGMRTLLRQQLIDLHQKYVVDGVPCKPEAKEQASKIYEAYHGLGGNGTGTTLYHEIMNIPTC